MSDSRAAERLLLEAERRQGADWLAANMHTAAAIGLLLDDDAIVVGGTAEAYWTGRDVYHATDLDLWTAAPLDRRIARTLEAAGFARDGRHWARPGLSVILEFPGGPFAGDRARVAAADVAGRQVAVIGLDDLYLDRLTQATATTDEGSVEFLSALSVATHRFDAIDWGYVSAQIARVRQSNPVLGRELRLRNRRVRQLIRRRLSEPDR